MGFKWIFAGFIFLFNPNFNVVDILPDFIGYAMIIYGLVKLRDLSSSFADAFKSFILLAVLSVGKLISLFFTMHLDDQGYLLVFTFVFTLAELYFMNRAFNQYFEGILFTATAFENDNPSSESNTSGFIKNRSETENRSMNHNLLKDYDTAHTTTIIFVFARGILTLLPEFVYLYVDEEVGYVLASYKGVLNVFSLLISLVIGIIWLYYMRKYYRVIMSEKVYLSNMEKYYNEVILPDGDLFLKRSLKFGLTLLPIGVIFLCDFYIDGSDVLFDIVGAAVIAFSVFVMRKYIPLKKELYFLCAGFALTGTVLSIYEKSLAKEYYAFGLARSVEGYRAYVISIIIGVVKSLVFAAFVYMLYKLLRSMIDDHTGRKEESQFRSVIQRDREKRRDLIIKTKAFLITGLLAAASCCASVICLYCFNEYWMINLLITVCWCIISGKTAFDINYAAEEKYM